MTQRLALCRALLHEPDLLILDEPYTGLDEQGTDVLDHELEELAGTRTLVVSTHDPVQLEPLASARLALA
jgi:ABC-type multidrug transport system ATPase subunit